MFLASLGPRLTTRCVKLQNKLIYFSCLRSIYAVNESWTWLILVFRACLQLILNFTINNFLFFNGICKFLCPGIAICNNIFKLSGNPFPQLFCLILISCAFCEIFLLITNTEHVVPTISRQYGLLYFKLFIMNCFDV